MSAIEWGRKGGKARAKALSRFEREASAEHAARVMWSRLSAEERSERARRAYAKRLLNAAMRPEEGAYIRVAGRLIAEAGAS